MKYFKSFKKIIFFIILISINFIQLGWGQYFEECNYTYKGIKYGSRSDYIQAMFEDWYYNEWLPAYEAAYKKAWAGYNQAWNENMQKGIERLNFEPQTVGVTPVNGALVLNEIDITIPGRQMGAGLMRSYNSKLWWADISGGERNDYLSDESYIGLGWNLNIGRMIAPPDSDSIRIYEASSGLRVYFKKHKNYNDYISTDGSFMVFYHDTIRVGDGTIMVFNNSGRLTKVIDPNCNLTQFQYSYGIQLDTIISSANERMIMYYSDYLDSVRFQGVNNSWLTMKYHYIAVDIDSSPFGLINCSVNAAGLLKSVVYPDGDSVWYEYNNYCELTKVHNPLGGTTKYSYKTDTFFIPIRSGYPPLNDTMTAILRLTRGVEAIKNYEPFSSDTNKTIFQRIFTTQDANKAASNADSVCIFYPFGNFSIYRFLASRDTLGRAGVVQWHWDNGNLVWRMDMDKDSTFLHKYTNYRKYITADSIMVIGSQTDSIPNLMTKTCYYEYDGYGRPCNIRQCSNVATSHDTLWIHSTYANTDLMITSYSNLSIQAPNKKSCNALVSFHTLEGMDSLRVIRHWYKGANHVDSTNIYRYNPVKYTDSISFMLKPPPSGYDTVDIDVKAWFANDSLYVWAHTIDLDPGDPIIRGPYNQSDGRREYTDRKIRNLLTEKTVTSDSSGSTILAKTKYYYDDSVSYVVKTYSPTPLQYDTSSRWRERIRGNLTHVENWKESSNYTKTEYRYDQLGNIVETIRYPSANEAETSFTYYDYPNDTAHVFPWRSVNHVSSTACSLVSHNKFDKHTGLTLNAFDANDDSAVYSYDNYGRVTSVHQPNEYLSSKRIHYKKYDADYTQPAAVIDSTQFDSRWLVSQSFRDGFGRTIQVQAYDFDSNRTIVQNKSYNASGQVDSVGNPYLVTGTPTMNYLSPTWNDVTRYVYKSLKRINIIYPGGDSSRVAKYANYDTLVDEKGNKMILMKNVFGRVDTVVDALSNKTKYTYDRLRRLTNVTDAEGKNTRYYYDNLGRTTMMICPDAAISGDSAAIRYEYNDLGIITRVKNPNGWVDLYYDKVDRPIRLRHSSNGGSSWTTKDSLVYDTYYSQEGYPENPKGRLSRVYTVGIDSQTYYYDDRGNLKKNRIGISGLTGIKVLEYTYNNANACTLLTLPNNEKESYHYNRFGRLQEIPNIINTIKYNPAGQPVRNNYANSTRDTIAYDGRLRVKKIKVFDGEEYSLVNLTYAYEKNSNVDSIIDSIVTDNRQKFAYDALNRLTNVYCPGGDQSFTYDKVGNRLTKSGTDYTYVSGTNRLDNVDMSWTYRYDNCGNVIRRSNYWGTVDTFIYNWHNRLTQFTRFTQNVEFAYNISGLRVKKHYYTTGGGGEGGDMGTGFGDPANDLGLKSQDSDSIYNKGRDISKVWLKNTANNYEFTIVNKKLFDVQNKVKLFITLDIDTIANSGRITLPEDTLTRVPKKAAWEYCLFIGDNEYGFYTQNGTKHSNPMGMLVNKVFGDSGKITLKISKQLLNNVPAIRYTLSTFAPGLTNSDSLWQGGSSAVDVWPGSKKTFGGDINGYGQITPNSVTLSGEYTIYYLYNGIDPILEYDPEGSILSRYIYANGKHVAEINGADTSWSYSDALGSTRKMADEAGYAYWSSTYYPFGEMTGDGGNEHSFTGKEFDTELGLNYFCMRYYDPEIGRFLELDIIPTPAFSPYSYCLNNPIKYSDINGARLRIGSTVYYEDLWGYLYGNREQIPFDLWNYIDGLPLDIPINIKPLDLDKEGWANFTQEITNGRISYSINIDPSAFGLPGGIECIMYHELWHAYYCWWQINNPDSPINNNDEDDRCYRHQLFQFKEPKTQGSLKKSWEKAKANRQKTSRPRSWNKFPLEIPDNIDNGSGDGLFWDWYKYYLPSPPQEPHNPPKQSATNKKYIV